MAVTGMAAAWFFWPALTTAALILWLEGRARRPAVLIWLLVCALCGGLWGQIAADRLAAFARHPLPDWALTGQAVLVEGRVTEARGLVDDRVRLFLEAVRPAGDHAAAPLPGRLAVTRDGAGLDGLVSPDDTSPLPGQWLRAPLKIRPLRPQNGLDPSRDAYWPRQNVSAVAYATRGREAFDVTGEADTGARLRETLRLTLVRALDRLYPVSRDTGHNPLEPALSAPQGWGVLVALLFGDRRYIGQTDMERFVQAGLAHSLALSGQHLAVVGLAAAGVALLLGRVRPGLFLRLPRFKLVAVLSVPLALGYVWLGDAPPSLVRAAVMLVLWSLCCFWGRFCGRVDLLVLALLLLVVPDPTLMHDTGLRLSFTAVAGLVLGLPLLFRFGHSDRLRGPQSLARQALTLLGGVLACSVAVHLASVPLILDVFGRLGPMSVLNVLWLPVLGLWVLPLAFAGLVLLGPLALFGVGPISQTLALAADPVLKLAMVPCGLLTDLLARLAEAGWLDSVWGVRPHWTAMLGAGCLFLALCLLARRAAPPNATSPLWPYPAVRRLLAAGLCLLLVGPLLRVAEGLGTAVSLRLLDVGQGQSVLLGWRGGERLLLDGGGTLSPRYEVGRDAVAPQLTRNAPLRVGTLALSHPHFDHLGGLVFVARNGHVNQLLVPDGLAAEPASSSIGGLATLYDAAPGVPPRALHAGEEWSLGEELLLEVLYPPAERAIRGNEGLIVRLVRREKRGGTVSRTGLVLLAGDAPAGVLRQLVATGRDLRAEILVAPHHASDANFVPAFVEAVAPREVWASLGWNNRFGFPGQNLAAYLAERGIPLRTTANEGLITKTW